MPPGRVLVGIDFSDASNRAVREAKELATALGAELEALHVREAVGGDERTTVPDERRWLEACALSPTTVQVRLGTAWVELARYAAEHDVSVVVVGSHGRGGYHPVSLGSTAARLTMASPRPVLVVGRRGPTTAIAAPGFRQHPSRGAVPPSSPGPAGSGND